MENTNTPRDWLPPLPCTTDSKFIRVLKIVKPEDPSDQEIVCSIETLNVAQDTSFTALSYVWGVSPSLTKTIRCNGKTVAVGTNCWSALWHLRNGYYSDDPSVSCGSRDTMTIWVDSICINQQDLKEKESQLRLMADIYSLARQVFVWLGEGTAESDAAVEYLKKAGFQESLVEVGEHQYELSRSNLFYLKNGFKIFAYQMTTPPTSIWKFAIDLLVVMGFPSHMFYDSTALQDIWSRTWASRIWTFQEILLNPRPLLCCGTKTLSWRSFIYSITFIAVGKGRSLSSAEHRWRNIVALWAYVQDSCDLRTTVGSRQHQFQAYLQDCEIFTENIIWNYLGVKGMVVCWIILMIFCAFAFVTGHWEGWEFLRANRSNEAWMTEFILGFSLLLSRVSIAYITVYTFVSFIALMMRVFGVKREPDFQQENINVRDAIIYEIATRKATNPKDKSFGLRAVLSKLGPQLDDPDYDKDLCQIYRELFLQLLDWSESLDLLLFCDSSTTSTLPSWMPNWAIDRDKSWLNRKSALTSKVILDEVFFQTPSQWSLTDNQELVVRGVHVCRISWSSGRFYETSTTEYLSDEQLHLHNISMFHDLMRRCYEWTPTTHSGSHHTLLHWERNKDSRKEKRRLKEWGQMMRRTSIMHYASMSAYAYLKSHRECFEFHINMCNDLAKRGRSLFLTEPGVLGIGNGPTNIQITDLVTLVVGVSKPLIMERRGTRYRLKGFAEMEYEEGLAMEVHMGTFFYGYSRGWEALGVEMQPRQLIVIY